MLKSLTTLAALAVVASGLAGAVATALAGAPQISHFTLSNGLEVVVIPDHRAPVVTHMLWYKVGSADEVLPVDEAREIVAAAPQGRLEVFPGAGHLLSVEQPEEFNGVLLDFLESV